MSSDIWFNQGDFTDDFKQRYLLLVCPLLAVFCSASWITLISISRTRDVGQHDENSFSKRTERDISRTRFFVLVETSLVLAALFLVIYSWESNGKNEVNKQAWVGVGGWLYTLFLLGLRSTSLSTDAAVAQLAYTHSIVLYGMHWAITMVMWRSAFLRNGQQSMWTPLGLGGLLTSLLLVTASATPFTTVAVSGKTQMRASLLQLATFSWLDSLIWTGLSKRLEMSDVWGLAPSDGSSSVLGDFERTRKNTQLLTRLLMQYRKELLTQAVWAVINSALVFMPTLLMQRILYHLEMPDPTTSSAELSSYLLVILLSGSIAALAEGQTVWSGQRIASHVRAIIVGKIYGKILRRSATFATTSGSSKERSDGKSTQPRADAGTINNLLVSDSSNIADAAAGAYEIWAAVPAQVAVALFLIFRLLGLSALAGIAMMLLMTPLNSIIIKHVGAAIGAAMGSSDVRVQETDQLLRHIRTIKYFVWQKYFSQRVLEKRQTELKFLRTRLNWWAIAATIWYTVPLVISLLSFFCYTVIQQGDLTPSVAFTALSLFNLLKAPLDQLVGMLTRVQGSLASIKRIEQFLAEPEIESGRPRHHDHSMAAEKSPHMGLTTATLTWAYPPSEESLDPKAFALSSVNVHFIEHRLNLIVGPTGSGKTSLLLALLGEMRVESGHVNSPQRPVAYCAQEPWLMNDTIRNNIVFTDPWDSQRYNEVLKQCGLLVDLTILKNGDATMVGDKGFSLSGGQKQRVALARAVYSSCTCVFLDDCLSAVDAHTARNLFENCIKGPLLAPRTCVLVTHMLSMTLDSASYVVALDHGSVAAAGHPKEVKSSPAITSLFEHNNASAEPADGSNQSVNDTSDGNGVACEKTDEDESANMPTKDVEDPSSPLKDRPAGHIPFQVLCQYVSSMGGSIFWLAAASLFIGQQVVVLSANWWIMKFSNRYSGVNLAVGLKDHVNFNTDFDSTLRPIASRPSFTVVLQYMTGYALIIALYAIVAFGRMYMFMTVGSVNAARTLHDKLLESIVKARIRFFDSVTHGTLLSRFSQDIKTIDADLIPSAMGTLHFFVAMIVTIVMIALLTPQFLIPGTIIMLVYLTIGRLFLDTSRELKRIELDQKATLYQQVGESVLGVVTLRAYGVQDRFSMENHARIDAINRPLLFQAAADRWLSFRLSITGTLMSFIAGYLAIFSAEKANAGIVGMSLGYAIAFSENVLWLVRYHAMNQQNFTAVERVSDCFNVEQEGNKGFDLQEVPETWPPHGSVRFSNFAARYRDDLPLVLDHLNINIRAGEKIGVVGRTGAGKSSLAYALLRNLDAADGRILIDDTDIGTIDINVLRRSMVFVPQDPMLFAGTLASNLDPLREHTRDELLQALRKVRLACDSDNEFANLDKKVEESGANLSQGQRQLVCLARAFLRKTKIVVMDEATASIDHSTDQNIQTAVSQSTATFITIAHRLRSIAAYDKVLVMEKGKVHEFGHPYDLLQHNGLYRQLCMNTGNFAELEALARSAKENSARGEA